MNPWLSDEEDVRMVQALLKTSFVPLGMISCTEEHFAEEGDPSGIVDYAGKLLWASAFHIKEPEPMRCGRAVLYELAALIDSITAPGATIAEPPKDDGPLPCGHTRADHASQFNYQVVHVFVECCVRGDLDAAMRVIDAVEAEASGEAEAFNETIELGAHVLASIAASMHGHLDREG